MLFITLGEESLEGLGAQGIEIANGEDAGVRVGGLDIFARYCEADATRCAGQDEGTLRGRHVLDGEKNGMECKIVLQREGGII